MANFSRKLDGNKEILCPGCASPWCPHWDPSLQPKFVCISFWLTSHRRSSLRATKQFGRLIVWLKLWSIVTKIIKSVARSCNPFLIEITSRNLALLQNYQEQHTSQLYHHYLSSSFRKRPPPCGQHKHDRIGRVTHIITWVCYLN